jgi:hypothetical protein
MITDAITRGSAVTHGPRPQEFRSPSTVHLPTETTDQLEGR